MDKAIFFILRKPQFRYSRQAAQFAIGYRSIIKKI